MSKFYGALYVTTLGREVITVYLYSKMPFTITHSISRVCKKKKLFKLKLKIKR